MTATCLQSGLALVLVATLTGCARPQPQTQPPPTPPPLPRDVVALAPDPESGAVGALTVRTPNGEVTLDTASQTTTVMAGQAPSAPTLLPPGEIQRLFGAALAAMPPPARRFRLYFDTGDVSLTAESRALVPDILATVKDRPVPEVSIVGHTDTTGGAAANVALGLRRAELIRAQLVAAGLNPRLVEVTSHGETNPVVPTPDNTAEARNRRVEVTVR